MKKLFLLLTVITLIVQSCSSSDDDGGNTSPFAGTWSGTFAGDDTGTWVMVFSSIGEFVSGSAFSNNTNETVLITSATINADGSGTSVAANGVTTESQFTETTSSGTWTNQAVDISGTITGTKQ